MGAQLQQLLTGSNYPAISSGDVGKLGIACPPTLAEQQAIAAVLSDVDELIGSLEALIAKKRDINQAAMQQLLTARTRLPGFGGEWTGRRLGELADIATGTRNNQDKRPAGRYPFFVRSSSVERIDSFSYDCEAILIPGEGRIGEIFHYVDGRFDVHQRVYVISNVVSSVSVRFLYFYIAMHFGPHAMQNTVKATVDSLRLPTFQGFRVPHPTLPEQRAIATVLSDMDAEIAALESRLDKTRAIKQGMMQHLLTGSIRLPIPTTTGKTTPMTPESQIVERKSSWCDDHLDCICGFANGRGGVLEIGRNNRGEVVGVADILRLLDEIPNRVQSLLGIVVNVDVRSDCGRDYLRIIVPPHATQISYRSEFTHPATDMPPDVRVRPDDSTRKQPENPDQPENRQKTSDRMVAFLRENPEASRRDIVAALGNTTEGRVRYQLDKLKASERLRRVGSDRGGHWMVVDGHDAEGSTEADAEAGNRRRPGETQPDHSQRTTRKQPENHQKTARNGDQQPEPLPLPNRILALLRQDSSASRREIAAALDTPASTVRYQLDKLRAADKIKRVGPDKGGHWKVLDDTATECDPTPDPYPGDAQ